MSGTASQPGASASWEDLARRAAVARAAEGATAAQRQLLAFELDGAPYAVAVESVREIVRLRPITPVPRVGDAVRGVISLRGEILQVVDLRRRLGLASLAPARSMRIIVVHLEDGRVAGLLVDAVREVLRVAASDIGPAPGEGVGLVEALCTRGEAFVSLLDLARALEVDPRV